MEAVKQAAVLILLHTINTTLILVHMSSISYAVSR